MDKLVQILRQARRAKGLTLEEISEQTKIRVTYLKALEAGDSSPFAGEVYFKGALRNYCLVVGLNPDVVLEVYRSLKEGDLENEDKAEKTGFEAPLREIPPATESPKRRKHPDRPAERKPEQATPEPVISEPAKRKTLPPASRRQRRSRSYNRPLIFLAALVLAVAIYIGYTERQQPPPEQHIPPGTSQPGDPEDPADPEKQNETPGEDPAGEHEPPAVTVTPEGTRDGETRYTVSGTPQVEVSVHLSGRCWVLILVDGRETHSGNYTGGQNITVTGEKSVWIRLGYPPAARLLVNGVEIEELQGVKQPHNYSISKQ